MALLTFAILLIRRFRAHQGAVVLTSHHQWQKKQQQGAIFSIYKSHLIFTSSSRSLYELRVHLSLFISF